LGVYRDFPVNVAKTQGIFLVNTGMNRETGPMMPQGHFLGLNYRKYNDRIK
jgi:hypothetical protein